MIHLDRITLREIALPLREPFRISSGISTVRRICLLELFDRSGATAWSECVAGEQPNYSYETIDSAWMAISEWVAPRILDRPLASPADAHEILWKDFRGHPMAKAAVEMGLWGLTATLRRIPLAECIGGIRDHVATGISLGIQDSPSALVERAEAAHALGYRKLKLKVRPGADVEYVAAVRTAVGREASLMVDANSAYTLDDVHQLQALDIYDLTMIEQPLAHDDLLRHAELQQQLATPICLDESITSLDRAEDMVSLGSGRIINIKPGRVGGFAASRAIHDFCEAHGIPVWCGGMLESGVGRAYNVALASLPNFTMPGDLSPSSRYWARDIVDPEWTMDESGMVRVPFDRPGLGVDIDIDRITSLTVRTATLTSQKLS
jgi:o-succinylbenzoate synthase